MGVMISKAPPATYAIQNTLKMEIKYLRNRFGQLGSGYFTQDYLSHPMWCTVISHGVSM